MDDILLNKAQTIERCIQRIREEYVPDPAEFLSNYSKQDSIILNIQRACEAAIDMGIRVLRIKHLGIHQTSREVFEILAQEKIISPQINKKMQNMVGFRNIAVHDYTHLNLDIVKSIAENGVEDILTYSKEILTMTNKS